MIQINISQKNDKNCFELEKKLQQLIFKSMTHSELLKPAFIISGEQKLIIDNLTQDDFIDTYINIIIINNE
jgi:hypothetical protein